MLSAGAIDLYNNAARNWNRLKIRAARLEMGERRQNYEKIADAVANDIEEYLGLLLKENKINDMTPVERLDDGRGIASFFLIKEGKLVKDEIFEKSQRYTVGTFKNGALDQGTVGGLVRRSCCFVCSLDISAKELVMFEDEVILDSGLRIDLEDHSAAIGTDSEKAEMTCYFCADKLPAKTS